MRAGETELLWAMQYCNGEVYEESLNVLRSHVEGRCEEMMEHLTQEDGTAPLPDTVKPVLIKVVIEVCTPEEEAAYLAVFANRQCHDVVRGGE